MLIIGVFGGQELWRTIPAKIHCLNFKWKNYIDYHYLWCHHKVRFRKAKIVRNLFQKVFILVQKAANLARFKKDLEKKLKISKTIAELSIVLSFVFFKQ